MEANKIHMRINFKTFKSAANGFSEEENTKKLIKFLLERFQF